MGVSFPELLIIMLVVLLVFGPEKLPDVARTLGKLMGELRKSSDQVRREFYNAVYKPADEVKRRISQEARTLIATEDPQQSKPAPQPAEQQGTVPKPTVSSYAADDSQSEDPS